MRIKELRCKAGLTQTELAARVGVTTSSISTWELGKCRPSGMHLSKVAHELNCSTDELYSESKNKLSEKFNVSEDIDNTIHSLCACIQQETKNYNNYSDEKALQEMTIALAELVKARVVNLSAPY